MKLEQFLEKYQKAPVVEHPNRVLETVPEPMASCRITTYQHADYIRDCLDGVLMQETSFPFEIIVGEDESMDGTREICMEYADRHPDKIRLFLNSRENNIPVNGKPSGKFNSRYVHSKCRGKYIATCEGDDYWTDPLKLQKQVDFLEANPDYVVCYHDAKIIDENGNLISNSKLSTNFYTYQRYRRAADRNKKDFSYRDLMMAPRVLTLTRCYRNVIKEFPEESLNVLNGDKFITILLGEHGHGKYMGDVIEPAVYRMHSGGGWTGQSNDEKRFNIFNTFLYIYLYYLRTGKEEFAIEFLFEKIAPRLLSLFPEKNPFCQSVKRNIANRKQLLQNKKKQAEEHYTRGNFNDALKILDELALECPEDAEVYNDIGAVYFAMGKITKSVDCFMTAIRLEPGRKDTRQNLKGLLENDSLAEEQKHRIQNVLAMLDQKK